MKQDGFIEILSLQTLLSEETKYILLTLVRLDSTAMALVLISKANQVLLLEEQQTLFLFGLIIEKISQEEMIWSP